MTQIHDLPNKLVPDGSDEIELQETGAGTSRKATLTAVLGAGLPVVSPMIHISSDGAGLRLEQVSPSRIQIMQGGTPVLIIEANGLWMAGPTASEWRIQRQQWPNRPMYASAGDVDSGLGFPAPDEAAVAAGGVEVARFSAVAWASNFLVVRPSVAGEPVDVEPGGADADIPLRLRGKGGGKVRIGPVTVPADGTAFVADRVLELEDEDGNAVFVPCSSTPF